MKVRFNPIPESTESILGHNWFRNVQHRGIGSRGVPRSLRQGGATLFWLNLAGKFHFFDFFRFFDQKKQSSKAGGVTPPPLRYAPDRMTARRLWVLVKYTLALTSSLYALLYLPIIAIDRVGSYGFNGPHSEPFFKNVPNKKCKTRLKRSAMTNSDTCASHLRLHPQFKLWIWKYFIFRLYRCQLATKKQFMIIVIETKGKQEKTLVYIFGQILNEITNFILWSIIHPHFRH
jgi:hypothetical protein